MILFAISFILIFTSSYFIASILAKKDATKGFIYTLLLAFAQIVLTSEILSPFYLIKEVPFLLVNILFFIISTVVWIKFKKPTWKFELSDFKRRFFNALNLDKSLWFLFVAWLIFIGVSIYLVIMLPATSADASCYHVVRSVDWVINHSLAHFPTPDIRSIIFPINSEILYMWILLFTKKQLFLGAFSFIGFSLILLCGYQIFKYFGYSLRQTIWTFGILTSLASVIVMVSGTETDLIIAGLIVTSIYLFFNALKNKSDTATLFMASLAYALAIGVKTPAIICIPAVGLLFVLLSYKHKDKISLLKFIGFGIINFVLFSAFNYVQNYISFGNISGEMGSIVTHSNLWGIKGMFSGFIKHLFLLVDFSGVKIPPSLGDALMLFENSTLSFFHINNIPNGLYCGPAFFNFTLIEPYMGCGILSFLLVLPCTLIALLKPIFCKDKKTKIEFIFALMFIINLLVLSAIIAFMTFNTRFITSFIAISFPILAVSYIKSNKNVIKILYLIIAIFYLTIISTNLWGRPFVKMVKDQIKTQSSIQEFRSKVICQEYDPRLKKFDEWCNLRALITSKYSDKNYKIVIITSYAEEFLLLKMMQLQGRNIEFINLDQFNKTDMKKYDVIIYRTTGQIVNNFNIREELIDINKHPYIGCEYRNYLKDGSKEFSSKNSVPWQKKCIFKTNFFLEYPFVIQYQTKEHYIFLNKNTFKF